VTGLTLTIPGGCNGPPGSGHGGYVCGRLAGLWAARHGGPAAVTLLLPPPLEVALTVTDGASRMSLWYGQQLLATVAAAGRQPTVTPPVSPAEAHEAEDRFVGQHRHPFPTCFVCGPDHPDGLRLRPGPVTGRPGTVACRWTPAGRPGTQVPPELVWSVLDCPSGWVEDPRDRPAVLSRMAARILRPVPAGTPHVVVGRRQERRARTTTSHSALYDAQGRLAGCASAVWTVLVPDEPSTVPSQQTEPAGLRPVPTAASPAQE